MIATYEPILSVEICSAGAHSEESLAVGHMVFSYSG